MSKRIRTMLLSLVALVVVIAAVAVLLVLLPSQDGDEGDATTTTTTAVADIVIVDKQTDADGNTVSAPVKQMDIVNASDSFSVITRDDGTMAVEAYSDLLADSTTIAAMCTEMSYLTALATTDANEEDSAYGLETPAATVTVTYHDSSTATLYFGAQSMGTQGYYCRRDGDSTLYIVDSTLAERYLIDGMQLIGKTLITPPSADEDDDEGSAQLLDLWLTGTCRDQAIAIQTDTDASYPGLTFVSTYVITSPYVRAVNSDDFYTVSTSMNYLTAAGVEAVHPTAEQLEAYGLADPYSVAAFTLSIMSTASADGGGTVTSHYNDRQHMVLLGNQNENGDYYALVDGYDIVYLLSSSSVPWAEWTYLDVANKLLFMRSITSVEEIAVTVQGEKTVFSLTHNADAATTDEKLTVVSDGKTYDTADFRTLYQLMIGIKRVAEKEEGASASGEPVLSLDMTFNDGDEPMSISLYPMTASRYLCVTNDGEEVAVSISGVEEFLRQYDNYLAGEPVSSPY